MTDETVDPSIPSAPLAHSPGSAALYRRYRPESFAEVIGQEHVTGPLTQALRSNRVNHAYLFSGPRGCGKTTSARILARILNCHARAEAVSKDLPDAPCGTCPSCRELSRGGSGSLDVVEIDAASHGGVDDARDLRERAGFAPARDRYKIFVIDEAHMVTPAGFNALLKIVEEPPEHVRFVFATTEPDKVLVTIRSRTHHYPFRLVPPARLQTYLEQVCAAEAVPVAKGVLPLVVRAGGGSVRDSLSVLDQLVAGAGAGGVDYEYAVALLGYTHTALLDDLVDALSAGDGAAVFRVVDRVVESGQDPRRFVEDVLSRFRDLVICQAVGDGAQHVLRGVPEDQLARMVDQASRIGAAELSRCADVTNTALTEMTGATSPRLHLELLVARLLLPGTEQAERGTAARVDRLERRIGMGQTGALEFAAAMPQVPVAPASEPVGRETSIVAGTQPTPSAVDSQPAASAADSQPAPSVAIPVGAAGAGERAVSVAPETAGRAAPHPVAAGASTTAGGALVDTVRRAWPDVLTALAALRRGTWTLVSQNAQVAGADAQTVQLAFGTDGLAKAFGQGAHADFVRKALIEVLGIDAKVEAITGPGGGISGSVDPAPTPPLRSADWDVPATRAEQMPPSAAPTVTPTASIPADSEATPDTAEPRSQGIADAPVSAARELVSQTTAPASSTNPAGAGAGVGEAGRQASVGGTGVSGRAGSGTGGSAQSVRDALRGGKGAEEVGSVQLPPGSVVTVAPEDDTADLTDPDADDTGLVGEAVVIEILGGQIVSTS